MNKKSLLLMVAMIFCLLAAMLVFFHFMTTTDAGFTESIDQLNTARQVLLETMNKQLLGKPVENVKFLLIQQFPDDDLTETDEYLSIGFLKVIKTRQNTVAEIVLQESP